MGVYGRLCVPRSIDSASILQQPCDPSVMLLIVTPAGSRASVRARQLGGDWGRRRGGWQRADCKTEDGKKEQESWRRMREESGRIAGAEMEKERRMGLRSLWDCVQGRPSWFLRPLVPLCPPMSLYVQPCPWTQSHLHSQITSVAYIPE